MPSPRIDWYYDFWKRLMQVPVWFAARPRRSGVEHTRRAGAFLLCSNHISHFDPPIIGAACARRIDWMAMEEMFRNPMMARLLRRVGAFPVNRFKSDRAALRTAVTRLRDGNVVGIFPEGGIRAGKTSVLEGAEPRGGTALLAVMANAPVVPCVILGSDRLYRPANWLPFFRAPVWVGFGATVSPDPELPKEEAREKLEADLRAAFPALKDRLVAEFGLRSEDLPQTPQSRKGRESPTH